jgi:hypothetical protein
VLAVRAVLVHRSPPRQHLQEDHTKAEHVTLSGKMA